MESTRQKFERLVAALEVLVAAEADTLAAGEYVAMRDIQRRAAPLVAALAELAPAVKDKPAHARLAALLARRQGTIDRLGSRLAATRVELETLHTSSRRVAKIAPVYGGSRRSSGAARLNVSG